MTVQSITAKNPLDRTVTLLKDKTYFRNDFTVPYLWLLEDVCDGFASAFGFTFDPQTELYVINDAMHAKMIQQDPSVTISLGGSSDLGKRIDITLPYGAFDV